MIVTRRSIGLVLVLVPILSLPLGAPAAAQGNRPPLGEPGTELGALIGAGSTSTHTGPMLSGIAGWRLNGWLLGEARGTWLARGAEASAFEADLGVSARLYRRGPASPYIGGGFGLYRADFGSSSAVMSDFYRRRLGTSAIGTPRGAAFTDPVVRLSAGVDVPLGRAFLLRPEASALFVRRDGRGETVGLFGLRLAYRFEDRPVTP